MQRRLYGDWRSKLKRACAREREWAGGSRGPGAWGGAGLGAPGPGAGRGPEPRGLGRGGGGPAR